MVEPQISEELKAFVLDHVDSVEQLEVLLLLREKRESCWTAAEVSRELRSSAESVANRLKGLLAKKLLIQIGELTLVDERVYQYQPQSEKLDFLVGRLAEMYRTRRFTVMNVIFSKPAESIRTFADAFKIKKGESKDNG